jgi:hypothetical protein
VLKRIRRVVVRAMPVATAALPLIVLIGDGAKRW